jgi:hypothetical protein
MTDNSRRPSSGKRVAIASARAAGATVGIGVAALAIAIAAFAPLPTVTATPAHSRITPVPTVQQLVCPGSFLRLGDDAVADATQAVPVGQVQLATGATSGEAAAEPLAGVGQPARLSPAGEPTEPRSVIAGSQSTVLAEPELSGFAAAACGTPGTDAWLVGGSSAVGRTTLITLSNPSDVASEVALAIFGESGAISAPGASGIIVEPKSQRVFSLAGLAPQTTSPVVHVSSEGGLIVAHLQQSITRGLEAAGADIIAASARPATTVTVPGLVVATPEDIDNRIAHDDASADLSTVVRIFAPGTTDATATVSVTPEGSTASGASFEVPLVARTAVDSPLDGLEPGTYSVTVSSDVPVVAAVRVSAASTPEPQTNQSTTDFAWLASGNTVGQATAFTVANGPNAALHVSNPSEAPIDVVVTAIGGQARTMTVPERGSTSIAIGQGTFSFSPGAPVVASIGYSSESRVAGFPVQSPVADAEPIVIYP